MSLSYANILTRVLKLLQDTGAATYDATETGYWIEDELKRFPPIIIEVVFQIESRTGKEEAGTASTLTDTLKSQFLAADATKEKVVHNITDDTWAVVTAYTSTSVLTLSRNIMAANESYEIYNKRCWNKRQIYIGDMPPFMGIQSVEYPIGTRRTFNRPHEDILELEVEDATIFDSDSTLTTLNPVDVLVRFTMPNILSQLTDWDGLLTANAVAGATAVAIDAMGNNEVIEVGEMFNLSVTGAIYTAHHATYIVKTALTLSGTGTGTIASFYPPLEAAALDNCVITFRKSTLTPQLEEILCQRVAARAMLSNTVTKLDSVPVGGQGTYQRERQWAMDILAETDRSLRGLTKVLPYKKYTRR